MITETGPFFSSKRAPFDGHDMSTRPGGAGRVCATTAALGAIVAEAQPGDLQWHGGADDFAWIAADNTTRTMDAQTVYAFRQVAMAHKQAHIFAARAIKDADRSRAISLTIIGGRERRRARAF